MLAYHAVMPVRQIVSELRSTINVEVPSAMAVIHSAFCIISLTHLDGPVATNTGYGSITILKVHMHLTCAFVSQAS